MQQKEEFIHHLDGLMNVQNLHDQGMTPQDVDLLLWKRGKKSSELVHGKLEEMKMGEQEIGQLIDQLLESKSDDQVRENRIGVILAIVYELRSEKLIQLITDRNTPIMIVDLIVKNLTRILKDQDEFMKFFNEKYDKLNDHVRIRIERCVRKTKPKWIPQLLSTLLERKAPSRECMCTLGHLESNPENDILIVKVLKDLKIELNDMMFSPLFRKHTKAMSTFLKDRIEEICGNNPQKAAQYFNSQKLPVFLLKQFPNFAWELISKYLVNPFLENKCQKLYLNKFWYIPTFYTHPSFVETTEKIISLTKDPSLIHARQLVNRLTIKQLAKILFAIIESFGYSRSTHAKHFIGILLFNKAKHYANRNVLFENMYSLGLNKEKFINWIVNNCQTDQIPMILNILPWDIASAVAERIYQLRKKEVFKNSSEESIYWKYFFNLDDNDQRNQFKNACSNPVGEVRACVLRDLLLCSLMSGKQVRETLEFIETRMKNDTEVQSRLFNQYNRDNSIDSFLGIHFKDHSELILNILSKVNSYSASSIYQALISQNMTNVEILKRIIISMEKTSNSSSRAVSFRKEVHQELMNHFKPTLEEMARNGSYELISFLFESIENPVKYDYINEFVANYIENVIPETTSNIPPKLLKGLVEVYLKSDPKNISKRVKVILDKYPLSFQLSVVQRALLDKRNIPDPELVSKFLPDHVLEFEELNLSLSSQSPLVWKPEVLSSLHLETFAPKQLLQSFSTYYKDYLFKVCRTGEISNFYCSRYSEFSERKQTLLILPKLLYERPMLDDLVQFIDEKILSNISLENVVPTMGRGRGRGRGRGGGRMSAPRSVPRQPRAIELNVEDAAVKSLAKLVRTNSQHPLEHLDWILENITSENVMYFYSALNRLSKHEPGFVRKFIEILKGKFSSGPKENFTISIQKVFICFFKQHAEFSGNHPLVNEIADFLLHLWDLKLHKDVQVAIVQTAKKIISKAKEYDLYAKLERLFKDAATHEYQAVVEELALYVPTLNEKIAQDFFTLSLQALQHKDSGNSQSKVWHRISQAVLSLDMRAFSNSFDAMSLFNSYLIDALLLFGASKDTSVTDIAIATITTQLLENTKQVSELLLEKIVKPLFTDDKLKTLNLEFDRPISTRLQYLAKQIATTITGTYSTISEETLNDIQQLILDWIGLTKTLEERISHACLVSSITNWSNKDSIIENSIKRVANLFVDMPDLKIAGLTTLCHNSSLFILTNEHSDSTTQAVSHILQNHSQYSQDELILAVALLKLIPVNPDIENLMKIINNLTPTYPLLAITYFIKTESDQDKGKNQRFPFRRHGY
ncbi:predicted protein [Naegleria gruberi]|uniref:Predicted protein n=1 Tax=Naegleria gruberi TaxID=5762 RepID=D2VAR0_NAEGR|nr:uncharacterized protein NAEGRDRAFT_65944 [Naegleria gruberi]EFC45995.1 predicted protein [Naegleria gruberi]|eukprot:XP_002678739.1 predicted protein [Naegleria gruberi strain NEG-M]